MHARDNLAVEETVQTQNRLCWFQDNIQHYEYLENEITSIVVFAKCVQEGHGEKTLSCDRMIKN